MAPFDTFTKLFPTEGWKVRIAQVMIDAALAAVAFWCAYLIRFEGAIPNTFEDQLVHFLPVLVFFRTVSNLLLGVYRIVWRYVGVGEVLLFARAVLAPTVVLLSLRLFLPTDMQPLKLPVSVIVLEATFVFLGLNATRLIRRLWHERRRRETDGEASAAPTLLVGAGQAGIAIAKEALRHPELGIRPIGFLDDDRAKKGMQVAGLRILGSLENVREIVRRTRAQKLLITSNKIPAAAVLRLVDIARELKVEVRTVPGLFEILGEQVTRQTFREVRIEDLLSRDPVPPSMSVLDLRRAYEGKRVLITGAGGSIGSELCRQLVLMSPKKLLLVERDENNLFEIHRELTHGRLDDVCLPILCDIGRRKDIEAVFRTYKPDVVFHAAAFKHVPMMERFPTAAVTNNVFGTKVLAELADTYGVKSFVMISTDKAVKPSSVMGASKRLAEMIVQQLGPRSSTRFSCVRFGNVLGSRGSVVPIFRGQIEAGGPVTVTHPEATRYFMTIPEAANLVLQAATLGDSGEVFLLDMGEPVKIIELARQMINLMGLTEQQCPIKIIGTRPGEKLFEELRTDAEDVERTKLRKILLVHPEKFNASLVDEISSRLDFALRAQDHEGVRQALGDLGIGYSSAKPTTTSGSYPIV